MKCLFIGILFWIGGFLIGLGIKDNTKDNNSIKFQWEGLEKDIPKDGIRELQLTTEDNIIYLNPVDR